MADTNEMIADIREFIRAMPPKMEGYNSEGELLVLDMKVLADRLEAAHRREIAEVEASALSVGGLVEASRHKRERGNGAKLRAAMVEILEYIESFHKYIIPGKRKKLTTLFAVADTIRGKARAALAAPPRNCDVMSASDLEEAFEIGVRGSVSKTCDERDAFMRENWFIYSRWAQMPYEEGGAK